MIEPRESNAGRCPVHGVRPSWTEGDSCEYDAGDGACGLSTRDNERDWFRLYLAARRSGLSHHEARILCGTRA